MKNIYPLILSLILGGSHILAQQNTILIIADDVGPDYFGVYSKTTDTAKAPNIRSLAESGIRYTKAWASPVCSPTRAGMLTGRYSFRTGVGGVIVGAAAPQLDTAEMTIAKLLKYYAPTKYSTACVGKWHVHNNAPAKRSYPNLMGFDFYSGSFNGAITDYYNYPIIRNGLTDTVKIYATTQTINDAIAWLDTVQSSKPFFLWVAFNAPHSPYHAPPSTLCSTAGLTGTSAHINANPKLYFKAAIEAMDSEIGKLMQYLKTKNKFTNTNLIFIGDNGNARDVALNADNTKSKETVYDYGVRIPFIVSGPRVTNKNIESDALINTVDIFATVAEMSGFTNWKGSIPSSITIDSRSFLPILNGEKILIRNWIFTEQFNTPADAKDGKTIRNQDYHLLRLDNGTDEFYNQTLDKEESNNLLKTTMSSADWSNYRILCDSLTALVSKGSCLSASINDVSNIDIKLYPNPSYDKIYLESNNQILNTVIYDMMGKSILSSLSNVIDISNLSQGVYFIEIVAEGSNKVVYKFAKY
jgi:arylsulfatase A-like enzyme